jgi:hypothetical protein
MKQPKKFTLCLHPKRFSHKPNGKWAGAITESITGFPIETNIYELSDAIAKGQCYTTGTFNRGTRNLSNWVQSGVLAVDVDHGNYTCSQLVLLLNDLRVTPNLVQQTFSSAPEDLKWRIIFVLSDPCYDALQYSKTVKWLCGHLQGDSPVSDPSRLFYGSDKFPDLIDIDAALDLSQLDLPEQDPVVFINTNELEINPGCGVNTCKQAYFQCIKWMQKHRYRTVDIKDTLERDCWLIMQDPVGERGSGYEALWHCARKLAQCAAYSDEFIYLFIERGLNRHSEKWQHSNHLGSWEQVVSKGIQYGRRTLRSDLQYNY